MDWKKFLKNFVFSNWLAVICYSLAAIFIYNFLGLNSALRTFAPVWLPYFLMFSLVFSFVFFVGVDSARTYQKMNNLYTTYSPRGRIKRILFDLFFLVPILVLGLFLTYSLYSSIFSPIFGSGFLYDYFPIIVAIWFIISFAKIFVEAAQEPAENVILAENKKNKFYLIVPLIALFLYLGILGFLTIDYLNFLDPNNCHSDDCFYSLAVIYKNPALCEKMEDIAPFSNRSKLFDKDYCFSELARIKKDIELCNRVYHQDHCRELVTRYKK